jgi:phage-related protein
MAEREPILIKKSRKTPTEDLDLAVRRMKELHNG